MATNPLRDRSILQMVPPSTPYVAWMGSTSRSAIAYPVLAWVLVRDHTLGFERFDALLALDGRLILSSDSRRRLREFLPTQEGKS